MTDPTPSVNKENEPKELEEQGTPSDVDSANDGKTEDSPPPAESEGTEGGEKKEESKEAVKEFTWGDGLSLDVSASQMSARIEIAVEYAEFYTSGDLFRFLRGNKIVHGVEEFQLQEILDKKMFNQPVLISKGVQPQNGKDGYVDWEVDLSILDGAKLVERAGRVDWKEHHHVLQVEEDQLLGRLVDPTDGEAGINVYGQELPPTPGKESKFPAGKGVRVSEDGKELYAELNGVVCQDGEKISVTETYTVQGDISLKTGNVKYDETVVISGNVMADFKVEAGQDIHVNGLVEAAHLEAGGNIYINGGIQGDHKAHVHADGDITVKFINNATVEAKGKIVVSGAITNSKVKSSDRVLVEGNKAVIVGGEIQAEKEISASILGSDMGVQTKLVLGVELQEKVNFRNDQTQKINALTANYKKLQQATSTLNQLRDKGKLSPEQTALRLKIIRGGLQLQAQIKRLQEEQNLIKEEIEKSRKEMVGVVAKQVAMPGTQIIILGQQLKVKTQTSKAIFALLKNEVNVFAYKEHEEKKGKKGDKEGKDGKEGKSEEKGGVNAEEKSAVADAIAKVREEVPGGSEASE